MRLVADSFFRACRSNPPNPLDPANRSSLSSLMPGRASLMPILQQYDENRV